jgi:hypothetical protein
MQNIKRINNQRRTKIRNIAHENTSEQEQKPYIHKFKIELTAAQY